MPATPAPPRAGADALEDATYDEDIPQVFGGPAKHEGEGKETSNKCIRKWLYPRASLTSILTVNFAVIPAHFTSSFYRLIVSFSSIVQSQCNICRLPFRNYYGVSPLLRKTPFPPLSIIIVRRHRNLNPKPTPWYGTLEMDNQG